MWSSGRSYYTGVNPLLLKSPSLPRQPFHLNMATLLTSTTTGSTTTGRSRPRASPPLFPPMSPLLLFPLRGKLRYFLSQKTAFVLCQQAAADMESEEAAHEAWVASLIPPPEAPVTDDEAERAAMIDRRRHFMATLMDQPLTEETLAAARAANIFIG